MASKYFNKVLSKASYESKRFIILSLDIAEKICKYRLENKLDWDELNQKIPNISFDDLKKIRAGVYNFTLRDIAYIESKLHITLL